MHQRRMTHNELLNEHKRREKVRYLALYGPFAFPLSDRPTKDVFYDHPMTLGRFAARGDMASAGLTW